MGTIHEYRCIKCDFYFEDDKDSFYYDSTLQRTSTYLMLFSTVGFGRDAEIKGHTTLSYCENCHNAIRTYYVTEYPKNFENLEEVLLKGIENEIINLKEELDKHITKLNEIKTQETYVIKEEYGEYHISAPDEFIDYYVDINRYSSEEEALAKCKSDFFEILDEEIEKEIQSYEIEKNSIKRIVCLKEDEDYFHKSDKVICPNCDNGIPDSTVYHCPKCGEDLVSFTRDVD